jgi:hypothetical protein
MGFDTGKPIGYIAHLEHFMKAGLRNFFFGGKKHWLPLLLISLGFGIQIAGKWLPTLVICYKANEKPKIEFLNGVCDCRRECAGHALVRLREGGAGLRSSCLDVPLITDPLCGPLLRFVQDCQCGPAHGLSAAPIAPAPFFRNPGAGFPPFRSERTGAGSRRVPHPGGIDSLFGRFIC